MRTLTKSLSCSLRPKLVLILLILLPVSLGHSQTTYYVAADSGNDSWTGLLPRRVTPYGTNGPWKTLANVNNPAKTSANSTIKFKRGCTWSGSITVPYSGMTLTAYDSFTSVSRPIIDGGGSLAGGKDSANWTSNGNGIWTFGPTLSRYPSRMWLGGIEYGVSGTQDGGNSSPDSRYRWYADTLTLKAWAPSNPAFAYSTIEVANARDNACEIYGKDHVTLRSLDLRRADRTLDVDNGSNFLLVDSCSIGWGNGYYSIHIRSSNNAPSDSGTIRYCTLDKADTVFHSFIFGGHYIAGDGQDILAMESANGWSVHHNFLADAGHAAINLIFDTTHGSWRLRGNRFFSNECLARSNDYGRFFGINGPQGKVSGNEFFDNFVHNLTTRSQLGGDHNKVYYNIFDTTRMDIEDIKETKTQHSGHILFWDDGLGISQPCDSNIVINNYFGHAQGVGITLSNSPAEHHNVFANNVMVDNSLHADPTDGNQYVQLWTWGNGSSTKDTLRNNIFFQSSGFTNQIKYRADTMTVADFNQQSGSGQDLITANLSGDPKIGPDYKLGSGSPAVNAGNTYSFITKDYFGNAVPFGGLPDIGVDERGADAFYYAQHDTALSQSATSGNNQRKLYAEDASVIHKVFESAGDIFYRRADTTLTHSFTTGAGTWSAPCVAKSSGRLIVVAQNQTGSSTYDIDTASSADNGVTWSQFNPILSGISCVSPGPMPSVAGSGSEAAVIIYRTSTGLHFKWSTTSGSTWRRDTASLPSNSGACNSPSSALLTWNTWHTVTEANVAYATDVQSGNPTITYNYFSFLDSSWHTPVNLSQLVPGSNLAHANPCLGTTASSGYQTVHVVGTATIRPIAAHALSITAKVAPPLGRASTPSCPIRPSRSLRSQAPEGTALG